MTGDHSSRDVIESDQRTCDALLAALDEAAECLRLGIASIVTLQKLRDACDVIIRADAEATKGMVADWLRDIFQPSESTDAC
jgi:hypothetical protein